MSAPPLVTIITPCYNSERTIADTLQSVLEQTYNKIEYIIIDGNSTDRTVPIIQEYQARFRAKQRSISYISEQDGGMYDAINKGFARANGEIITYINSDDWYTNPHAISAVSEYFDVQERKCIYGDVNVYNESRCFLRHVRSLPYRKRYIYTLGLFFYQPSFFWRRELFRKTSLCDTSYRVCSDYDLISRLILASNHAVERLDATLVNYRDDPKSFGNTNSPTARKESDVIRLQLRNQLGAVRWLLPIITPIDQAWQKIYRKAAELRAL